jgi:hypothetical protein
VRIGSWGQARVPRETGDAQKLGRALQPLLGPQSGGHTDALRTHRPDRGPRSGRNTAPPAALGNIHAKTYWTTRSVIRHPGFGQRPAPECADPVSSMSPETGWWRLANRVRAHLGRESGSPVARPGSARTQRCGVSSILLVLASRPPPARTTGPAAPTPGWVLWNTFAVSVVA